MAKKLTIDGKEITARDDATVIQAAHEAGIVVPHYCYHPKLTIAGNCRMCLVDTGMPKLDKDKKPELGPDGKPVIMFAPKLAIGCNTAVAEGMVVHTRSPKVVKAREGVLEFLLINHPLDCPICDQAGECRLQEFSVEYGTSESRFVENKVKKPKNVVLGPRVTLDDERCILCSHCIRFCQEIARDDVLGFVDRGSYTLLTAHPGKRLENNYSLNTVDICPVGALTSSDFRFKMRVWFLKETKSICTSCATGCNTIIGTREDVIYRQTPRENNAVNSCWMCDYGRLNFDYVQSERRLLEPQIVSREKLVAADWRIVIAQAAEQIKQFSGPEIAIVASGRMTNEELWLTLQLAKTLDVQLIDIVPRTGPGDDILLSRDRNPNTNGARLLGVTLEPGAKLPIIADAMKSGRIKALITLGENPMGLGISAKQLADLSAFIVMDILANDATEHATVVLPSFAFAEKRGSMINGEGRLQRLNRAVRAPGQARDDWEILRDLIQACSGQNSIHSIEEVFRQMAEIVPQFAGLSLTKIGDLGIQVMQAHESPPPPIDPAASDIETAESKRPPAR